MTPVNIILVDTQLIGPECMSRLAPAQLLLAPMMLLAEGCALLPDDKSQPVTVVYPLTFGPWTLYNLTNFILPDAGFGHELRHAFDGEFHPDVLPFVDLPEEVIIHEGSGTVIEVYAPLIRQVSLFPVQNLKATCDSRVIFARVEDGCLEHTDNVCVIWVNDASVSYTQLGYLGRRCFDK